MKKEIYNLEGIKIEVEKDINMVYTRLLHITKCAGEGLQGIGRIGNWGVSTIISLNQGLTKN